MKMLSNTEVELRKSVTYKKNRVIYFTILIMSWLVNIGSIVLFELGFLLENC